MDNVCEFPTDLKDGKYSVCGKSAMYKVGFWDVCEGHKKHYCDPRKWEAIKLEELDEETSSGC
jgi:hypothetical protein